MRKLFVFFFLFFFQISVFAQLGFEKLPAVQGASISYLVRDLWTGKTVASFDSSRVLAPASVLKLFTTAVALDVLGSKKKVNSSVYLQGIIQQGVLQGDLIIDGNFNPTLGAYRFNQSISNLVDSIYVHLKREGIHTIAGQIKIIEEINSEDRIPRTWIWEDMGNYFGAGAGRTILNENVLKLHLKSGSIGTPVELVKTEPAVPWLKIDCKVIASKINRDLAYCFARPNDQVIAITGTIPANRSDFIVKAAIPDPAATLGALLKLELKARNLKIQGGFAILDDVPVTAQQLLSFPSAGIGAIVRKTNQHSVNVFAESLLNLSTKSRGEELKNRTQFLKRELSKNMDVQGMTLHDGSGLSRFNAVSAKQTVSLIEWMNKHKEKKSFLNSLAVAGEKGTFKNLLRNTIAKGRITGKSGYMQGVKSYAGIINTRKGENLAFAVIVNNYHISNGELKRILEKWLFALWDLH